MDRLPVRLSPGQKQGLTHLEILLYEDLCFLARRHEGREVRISQRRLARRHHAAVSSIARAARGLVGRGLLAYRSAGRHYSAYRPLPPAPLKDLATSPDSSDVLCASRSQSVSTTRTASVSTTRTDCERDAHSQKDRLRIVRKDNNRVPDVAAQKSGPAGELPSPPASGHFARHELAYTPPPTPSGPPEEKSLEGGMGGGGSPLAAPGLPEPGTALAGEWVEAGTTPEERSRRAQWASRHPGHFRAERS